MLQKWNAVEKIFKPIHWLSRSFNEKKKIHGQRRSGQQISYFKLQKQNATERFSDPHFTGRKIHGSTARVVKAH
jgi:hypothetical protein